MKYSFYTSRQQEVVLGRCFCRASLKSVASCCSSILVGKSSTIFEANDNAFARSCESFGRISSSKSITPSPPSSEMYFDSDK